MTLKIMRLIPYVGDVNPAIKGARVNNNVRFILRKGELNLNIISAEKISKSYSEKILFDEISIGINEGERICLIGINGTGKSTLLKVIAGVENSDTGRIITGNSMKIEYLSQNPIFQDGISVLGHIFKIDLPVMNVIREYEDILQRVHHCPEDGVLAKMLIDITQKMDIMDAWSIESEAKSILTQLKISDFHANIDTLSGGQKKRVAMASALLSPADLLILDEPTNHIDNDTVDWLEKYLNNRKGALLMVTHDRYFLERVANRIVELNAGKLYSYQANYSKYLEMKVEREENEQSTNLKKKSLLKSELEWIKKGAKARSTKQKARIDRFYKLQDEQVTVESGNVEITVGSSRLGKKIIELEHISKSYGTLQVVYDFNYFLMRDDRIGIIGLNGRGKSTLLKIIAGIIPSDTGTVSVGATVKVGYFSQESEEMDGGLRVIDYIREVAEFITTSEGTISASQMLERFLFPPSTQWTPISKLSGGEKRRLYLLRVLMDTPNVLLLDEPTNDLDIQTLSILEEYLEGFPGAVMVVSHDRFFLDRVATKIFLFEENGNITQSVGNYSDYRERQIKAEQALDNERKIKAIKDTTNQENKKQKFIKLTFKEQKELENIDSVISSLESELREIVVNIEMASSNFELLQKLVEKQKMIEDELNIKLERWVYLNEIKQGDGSLV